MSEPDCQSALIIFSSRKFESWRGLPPICSLEQVTAEFPLIDDSIGLSRLGETKKQFRNLRVDGYRNAVRAWLDDSRVLLLDTAYPQLAAGIDELEKPLGQPERKLDYDWGTLKLHEGEWIYPSRGLALFVVPSNGNVVHLAVFPPASAQEYMDNYRVHLGKRLKPLKDQK